MNLRKSIIIASVELCLAAGMWTVAAAGAEATVVLTRPDADFSAAPYTISFGAGAATYTFTDIYDPSTDPLTVAAVSTGGDAMVNSFLGQPIAFQEGALIGATGYGFSALPAPTGIPYSIAEDSIGLAFSLPDGIHYGFVTTLGPEVVLYGYNTTPGGFITVGVPEPATWAMFIIGMGVFGVLARKRAIASPRPA
ncbi:MAG: PEPxxWA-CTERM sorting domain-containing protein [Roseiarcus sp.]